LSGREIFEAVLSSSNRGCASLDEVFGALSDPIRRGMIERLAISSATVSELAEPFNVSLPAIMRHVGVLESAGLLESDKRGRERHCRMAHEPPHEAIAWIVRYGRFWEQQLESLAAFLERTAEDRSA
jgi:DNA-binding transcriptional ArsR family regulator